MNLVSIIIPVYNKQKYLAECLDSFSLQTDKKFNVIIIDDGSTDISGEIAKKYVLKFPDLFEYHYQKNMGLGGARNSGLQYVKTPYVMYFDSDDFMGFNGMNHVVSKIKSFDGDALFFNPVVFNSLKNSYERWYDEELIKKIFAKFNDPTPKKNPIMYRLEASVCRMIWKTSFLRESNFKFLEHVKWEDVPAHFFLFHRIEKCSFLDNSDIYYYRTNSENQITGSHGKTRLDIGVVLENVCNVFSDKSWSVSEKTEVLSFLANYLKWMLRETSDEYREQMVSLMHLHYKRIKKRYICSYLLFKNSGLKGKIFTILLRFRLFNGVLLNRSFLEKVKNKIKKIKRIFK